MGEHTPPSHSVMLQSLRDKHFRPLADTFPVGSRAAGSTQPRRLRRRSSLTERNYLPVSTLIRCSLAWALHWCRRLHWS